MCENVFVLRLLQDDYFKWQADSLGGFDVVVEVCKVTFLPTGSHMTEMKRRNYSSLSFCHWEMIRKTPFDPYPQPGKV